jgi:hypothetical protein
MIEAIGTKIGDFIKNLIVKIFGISESEVESPITMVVARPTLVRLPENRYAIVMLKDDIVDSARIANILGTVVGYADFVLEFSVNTKTQELEGINLLFDGVLAEKQND